MRANNNNGIFNNNISTKKNIIILIIGILLTIVPAIVYLCIYQSISVSGISINKIGLLLMTVIPSPLGMCITISAFNLQNNKVRYTMILLLGALIYAVIREEPLRMAFGLVLFLIFLFVIMKLFGKVISTIITLLASCIILVVFLWVLCIFKPDLPSTITLYIGITVMLLLYNIFGVKMNQFCLKNIWGESKEKIEEYDYGELKNQINLIYLIVFIVLNVMYIFSSETQISSLANCVNNSLITGVCITNVNWKSLFWKNNKNLFGGITEK